MVWIGNSTLYGENKTADALIADCGAEELWDVTGPCLLFPVDEILMNIVDLTRDKSQIT